MNMHKILLAVIIALLVAGFFALDLGQYLSLEFFKSQQLAILAHYEAYPFQTAVIFFALYIAVTGLSLPGAALMTLIAGAIFGLLWGTVIVSFASTIGATLAFLISRFLLRKTVQSRFGDKLRAVNAGVERDGAFYLFALRLVPAFPFFVINLVIALTPLRTLTFYWVSQIGMLPGTLVYVNAGTQIGQLESLGGILSPSLIASFVLLGLFPLIARKALDFLKARHILRKYRRPKQFDRDLVVIGAGSAGLVSAYIASTLKAKVSLVEQHKMGGDCLNTGCVPSKALLRSAKFLTHVRRAKELGMRSAGVEFDFADVMQRVQRVVKTIEPHDSVERYTDLGVECLAGRAYITSPYTVAINGRTLTTRHIVIATGAQPLVPPLPGLKDIDYLTSENVWDLRQRPERLVILGGGPIGAELAQAFARLGSQVTLVEMQDRLLLQEDPEISAMVMERFRTEAIDVRVKHQAKRFLHEDGQNVLVCDRLDSDAAAQVHIPFDQVLVAVGRKPNTAGYGLEELGMPLAPTGAIEVNQYMQTRYPNIFACGDVVGPYQFTHTASHQAWYASVNALFGAIKRFKVDYSVIPWATFTEPEVARVGLNEQQANARNIAYEVTRYEIADLDRAIAEEEAYGLVKVLTPPGKDKILGATIVGEHAADLVSEYILAMRHGLGLNKILSTIHIYPTLAEANKYAAGNWRRAHAPQRLLQWLGRYHAWRRGAP